MLGMVNHALQEMVTDRLGEAAWESIRTEAGVEDAVGEAGGVEGSHLTNGEREHGL